MSSANEGTAKHKVSIHWFRNGLRFHDNPCLSAACEESDTMIPLYVINPDAPFAQTQGLGAGCIRANFALESIKEVDTKLRTMGSQLLVVLGDPEQVLAEVVALTEATAVYYEQEAAAPVRESDARTLRGIQDRIEKDGKIKTCKSRGFPTHTLHPMEVYLGQCKGGVAPATYGGFTKIFTKMSVPKEIEQVKEVPPIDKNSLEALKNRFEDDLEVPSLERLGYTEVKKKLGGRDKGGISFIGGEDAALDLLDRSMKRGKWVAMFEKPKTSPNALKCDTTGLSPYVKHGCLSPRRFYHELSKVYARFPRESSKPPVSLHGQLMWREYNYLMGYSTPNFDKMIENPVARQIPWDDDPELLRRWRNSQTGYPFVDAIMTQLRETGWIHHLARHMVACFLTRGDLWQSWEKGAEVFESELIDADWSINNFNWQWLSCTAHFYQYFRCYSPVAFGKKTDPNGDYIRKWLPLFKDMPAKYIYEPWDAPESVQKKCGVFIGKNYPAPLVEHKATSKSNMSRMKEAYDAQKRGDPMPEPSRRPPPDDEQKSQRTSKRAKR